MSHVNQEKYKREQEKLREEWERAQQDAEKGGSQQINQVNFYSLFYPLIGIYSDTHQ